MKQGKPVETTGKRAETPSALADDRPGVADSSARHRPAEPLDRRQRRPYEAPALLDLAQAGLQANGRLRLRVIGGSMAPLLDDGDTVTVEPVRPGDLRCGDVLVIRIDSSFVTHRLVTVDDRGWQLKGDNAARMDDPVPANAIVGRVIHAERNGRWTDFRTPAWRRVNRWLGRLGRWETRLAPASGGPIRAGNPRDGNPPTESPPAGNPPLIIPGRMLRPLFRRLTRALIMLPEIGVSS
jgi:hypothetical protein